MPIKLDCPRCKKPLAVPSKKIGSYVNCPHCTGRFWVPDPDAPENLPLPAPGQGSPSRATPPPAPNGSGARSPQAPAPPPVYHGPAYEFWRNTPAVVDVPAVHSPANPDGLMQPAFAPPPAPPAGPLPPPRRVARFISAETADSPLKLAEDGKLPELHLKEPGQREPQEKSGRSVHPLLLLVLLCTSMVLSTALVFIDFEPQDASGRQRAERARSVIQEEFFANLDPAQPLEPYQLLLREAQRAHSVGDIRTERQRYQEVLRLLRAERGKFDRGLTGSRGRDEELEEQIAIVLSEL